MREIKFRAYHLDWNKYFENGTDIDSIAYISQFEMIDLNRVLWEQYTGLKDKNSVDIYEGDIVKLYSETHDIFGFEITKKQTGRIYFVDGAFFISGGNRDDPIYVYEGELEIIGNIHENADLLEEHSRKRRFIGGTIMKYQKKPVTVEAFQWENEKIPEWFRILGYRTYGNNIDIGDDSRNIVYPGDYIIRDEDGEIYSCKPDIFEETYVKVDDTDRISPDDIGNDIHEFLHGGDK